MDVISAFFSYVFWAVDPGACWHRSFMLHCSVLQTTTESTAAPGAKRSAKLNHTAKCWESRRMEYAQTPLSTQSISMQMHTQQTAGCRRTQAVVYECTEGREHVSNAGRDMHRVSHESSLKD